MTRERTSLIAGVGVLMVTVILAGIAVTAHNNNQPEPEWLMVMNAETNEFQDTPLGYWPGPNSSGLRQLVSAPTHLQ